MAVTEQIDALRALAIDPIGFLMVPRFLAIVITLFLSTVSSDALALVGAALAGWVILGVEPLLFYQGVTSELLGIGDVMHGLIKSVFFGVVIALSSCRFGASTSGGAPGVGRSVVTSVVVSAICIFAVDYFISFAIG
jgi:phospholipid/cholesterol/gamma-HCH transport system permease protein